jgi:polyphosphate glucokinase
VAEVVAEVARHFCWQGPIGCTFPAPIKGGIMQTAANVDESWIGVDGEKLFSEKTGLPVRVINDADAAGIAEMRFGAGKDQCGVIMLLTFGTGIGSAIFVSGSLMPNTELGHMELRGRDAERWASDSARKRKHLTWEQWAARVQEYLGRLELLFSPDLFIIGGGVSREHDKFLRLLRTQAPVVPAAMLNDAGIVGAALAASELSAVSDQPST